MRKTFDHTPKEKVYITCVPVSLGLCGEGPKVTDTEFYCTLAAE